MNKKTLKRAVGCVLALSMSMSILSACAGKKDKDAQKPSTNIQQPNNGGNTQSPNNGGSVTPNPNPNPNPNPTPDPEDITEADKYKISVACQSEMGEQEVLKILIEAYEEKNPDVEIELKTFSGAGFEQYMLGIAAQNNTSPNIIWTADTYHSPWDEYFLDLRPYYEASSETDYNLFYEAPLDGASTNGYFKPTKNYKGTFRSDDLDENSDGKESYNNHSEYGLFYAPRDYNKPAILCNTYLFKELDSVYEETYKTSEGVSEMPSDYVSTTSRLQGIVNGDDWDSLDDLTAFTQRIAQRIEYIVNNATSIKEGREWSNRAALYLNLAWEPVYTTVMNELGVDLLQEDGTLNLENNASAFQALRSAMFPSEDLSRYTVAEDMDFGTGRSFMAVTSRPVALGYANLFKGMYGETSLQAIQLPVENIAMTSSGYAISNIWDGKGMMVDGVYKSYNDLSWDFIKFVITEEGQEIAGETGLNIPVLKKLYSEETNGGVTPAWRKVEIFGNINHDAWVAGGELRQDTFHIYTASKRAYFQSIVASFFSRMQYSNSSLEELIRTTVANYNAGNPTNHLR